MLVIRRAEPGVLRKQAHEVVGEGHRVARDIRHNVGKSEQESGEEFACSTMSAFRDRRSSRGTVVGLTCSVVPQSDDHQWIPLHLAVDDLCRSSHYSAQKLCQGDAHGQQELHLPCPVAVVSKSSNVAHIDSECRVSRDRGSDCETECVADRPAVLDSVREAEERAPAVCCSEGPCLQARCGQSRELSMSRC